MLVLVVVMAAVLLLVAEAWKRFGPAAIEINGHADVQPVSDHGEAGAGQALRSGQLPRLHDAEQRTEAHAADVKQALQAVE